MKKVVHLKGHKPLNCSAKKSAFSLVEMLMALLVASLLMAALAPVITKKVNDVVGISVEGNIPGKKIKNHKITYEDCINIIETLRFNEESSLFAVERDKGLESIIGNIYQSFAGQDIYKSIEEKGANFLYLIVKNHVFADGNKRIGATLFIYFLKQVDVFDLQIQLV